MYSWGKTNMSIILEIEFYIRDEVLHSYIGGYQLSSCLRHSDAEWIICTIVHSHITIILHGAMSVSSIGNFGRLLRAMKRAIRILGKQRRSKVGGKRGRRKGGRGGDDNFLEPIVKRKRAKVKSELILHNSYYNLS